MHLGYTRCEPAHERAIVAERVPLRGFSFLPPRRQPVEKEGPPVSLIGNESTQDGDRCRLPTPSHEVDDPLHRGGMRVLCMCQEAAHFDVGARPLIDLSNDFEN